jgi:hypothetical protein
VTALFTVTCRSRALAVVRARTPDEAIERARDLVARRWRAELEQDLAVREPDDGEMVGWLRCREDLLLPGQS